VTKLQAEIVVRLANNSLNVSETAKEMFLHRNSINYHVRKIHKLTGKNPLNFYDMCDLLPKAQSELNDISEQTINALYAIGKMTHPEEGE
jgi:hypothetical protein